MKFRHVLMRMASLQLLQMVLKKTDQVSSFKMIQSFQNVFCTVENNRAGLRKTHNYLCQGQMAIAGVYKCDFIVWTMKA